MVEKPFSSTIEEASRLLSLAKESGLIITPYQNRRFDSDFLALKQVISEKYLGDII